MKVWTECSLEEKVERWENVKRVVAAVGADPHAREHHWSMRNWAQVTECGTVGCAAGHCSMDPWFKEQGFGSRQFGYAMHILRGPDYDGPEDDDAVKTSDGNYWTSWGWGIQVDKFFGQEGVRQVFLDDRRVTTPEDVIAATDRYIASLKGVYETYDAIKRPT